MKFVTFSDASVRERLGAWLKDDLVVDLSSLPDTDFVSMQSLIDGGDRALRKAEQASHDAANAHGMLKLDSIRILPPLPRPRKNVFCVGLNYMDHIKEGNFNGDGSVSPDPEFFTKPVTCICGHLDDVPLHAEATQKLDYEVELAIIIGRGGVDIPEAEALDRVFGYTILNDVTGRDLQFSVQQWFKGKSLDRSCPIGPCIVTADEIGDPQALRLKTAVNGEVRQDETTAKMVYDVRKIVSFLSKGLTLEPGDIIATGTPSGIGYSRKPPVFLKRGDEVVLTIDRIGELRNRIA